MLIEDAAGLSALDLGGLARPAPVRGMLMVDPAHFDVIDVKNPHMEGWLGRVDRARARTEWEGLAAAFEKLHIPVTRLAGREDLVDQVFIANPLLMGARRDGAPFAILSRMRHEGRRAEVGLVEEWVASAGIERVHLPEALPGCFEGGGDALWHPDHYLLWAATGPRSDREPLEWLADHLDLPIALLTLTTEELYHLDTCFQPLDEETVAWVPDALSEQSRAMVERGFPRRITVDAHEAETRLAGNLYCPDRRHVLLPSCSPRTRQRLESHGFVVQEIPTDEYLKSGGSVFCLRQELYGPPGAAERTP